MMVDAAKTLSKHLFPHLMAVLAVVLAAAMLVALRESVNTTTVALALLLVVLFIAAAAGSRPATTASVAAMLCFNYCFLPPFGALTVADPQNWTALAAFLIVAIVAGQLSSVARRRAEVAERQKQEIERLYEELQIAFEKESRTEAIRQSEKLKSALLDAVTHDLRTPLTSIKAAITTLIDDENKVLELDHEGKSEFLEIINEETDRLNRFIEGMVELARQEAGAMQLRQTWSDVREIISAALERASSLLKNHRVTLEIERELPIVRVDAQALAEVVYTLLDNAAKYSPPNTKIWIAARRAAEETIEIAVADEGRGIAPEMRTRIFDKFFRAALDEKEQTAVGGLGLGLAIARGIVESHNGRIWVAENENGKGAKFVFTVPIGDE